MVEKLSINDKVTIVPYIGLLQLVHDIEAKIKLELNKRIDKQRPCLAFLETWEIETLENFYYKIQDRFYERSSWVAHTQSPNAVHYKFFIDQVSSILLDYEIISTYNHKIIGSLISDSDLVDHYKDKLNDLKTGQEKAGFDVPEDTLNTYYSEIWWEVENYINDDNVKKDIQQRIDNLFSMQYNLYGYSKGNPLYEKIKNSYYKLLKTVGMADKILEASGEPTILSSYDNTQFNSFFHTHPNYEYYDRSDFIPYRDTWLGLKDRIIAEFKARSLSFLDPYIESITDDIIFHIDNQRRVEDYTDGYTDGIKKSFLRQIINCPDTEVLKLVEKEIDLEFLLFGPESMRIDKYLSRIDWQSLATFDRVLTRISMLDLSDFEKVGLGEYIDSNALDKLKEHTNNVVNELILSLNINSYYSIGITYHTRELRDLQLDAIRALWKATIYHSGDYSISYAGFCQIYGIAKGFYTHHVTRSGIITNEKAMLFASKLDEFLIEESSSIITPTAPLSYSSIINDPSSSLISTRKSLAYFEAREKLLEFMTRKQETIDIWLESDTADKTWFDKLFAPTSRGYAFGFDEPLYQAFSTIIDLLELLSTDPISGIPIPDGAFDVNDKNFKSSRHHIRNKLSLALSNQIMTMSTLGLHNLYESMSQASQDFVKQGLRELILTGILKSESQGRSGSGLDLLNSRSSKYYSGTNVKQWVTLSDFLKIFPTTLTFTFKHDGLTHTSHLLEVWEAYLGKHLGFGGFDKKLFAINEKIQKFKDDIKSGNNPYEGHLDKFLPITKERFFEDAKVFSSQLWRLIDDRMFSGLYNERDLVNRWQIYLMRKSFEI